MTVPGSAQPHHAQLAAAERNLHHRKSPEHTPRQSQPSTPMGMPRV
jgi:hypothetical protein